MARFKISGAEREIQCEGCGFPLYSGDWAYEGEEPYERDGIFCAKICAKEPVRKSLPAPEPTRPAFRLSDHSPNTMMIMGAVLSGGDPLKLAKRLVQEDEGDEPTTEETP